MQEKKRRDTQITKMSEMVPEELQKPPRRTLRVDKRNTILTDGGPKGSPGWPRDPK